MTHFVDYVYQNAADTIRVRVFKTAQGWDFDLFLKNALSGGWRVASAQAADAGDVCATKKAALEWAEGRVGTLTPGRFRGMTEGWPERVPPKATKDAAVEIAVGQIWRFGSRRLRVLAYSKNPMKHDADDGKSTHVVGCRFIDPSGRETARMMNTRTPAYQTYPEQRFREKFRFVSEPAEDA